MCTANLPDLEGFPEQPCQGYDLGRLLHGAHSQFSVLFVFVVLANHLGRVVHFNVTEHPTAVWKGQLESGGVSK